MKFKFTTLIMAAAFLLSGSFAWSQSQTPLDIALRHVEENFKKWELTQEDVSDMAVSDMYQSKHNGVTHIYFRQRYQGIALQNAILNLNINEHGEVFHVGKRFYPNLSNAVTTTSATLTPDQALQKVLSDLNISAEIPRPNHENNTHIYTYDKEGISKFDVNVELTYMNIDSEIFLVWNLIIDPVGKTELWDYSIDAYSGLIIEKRDMVIRCKFENDAFHNHNECGGAALLMKKPEPSVQEALTQSNASAAAGSYRVFEIPTESPIHGPHVLVTDPENTTASPFGWHDINGDPDPEYTITRGNNVHAYEDTDGDGASSGNEPDGGMSLVFDFPYISDGEAEDNMDAGAVNLFYMNNIMHDFTYLYGFNEEAGNFQRNNYGNGGQGNDEVIAHSQSGQGTNNATFGTPPDGGNGTMRMFRWDNPGNKVFNVTAPSSIAGQYPSITAGYGPGITSTPISAEVIEVDDSVNNPYSTDGCEEFTNASEIDGKIALVDRGGCWFEQKTANAEAAGAVAIIICNFEDDAMGMAGVPEIDDPNIPTVSLGAIDCNIIRQFAGNGLEVTLVTPTITGPDFLGGDFDNGIIAHEFGHGVSNRLTGGPAQDGCLSGGEQMGEGWSDFFSLVTTVKPGDDGVTGRGVGTYVQRQETDGPGFRPYRYSTDMNVNPLTYTDVASYAGSVHSIGTVWNTILWDLYWAMVDEHGFDDDQWTGTGGNNMAIQLVMDGMKMQPCNPGFVDGRDAILAADQALYNGENQCLIWEVFARRGVGFYADQGDPLSAGDQTADFEPLPTCIAELKIRKSVSPIVNAGDEIDVEITITNHRNETLTGVVVNDELNDGTQYINGSASGNVIEGGVNGGLVTFELGTMEYLDEITFTYKLSTDESNYSVTSFYEDVEEIDPTFWFPVPITGSNFFQQTTTDAYSGTTSWFVESVVEETQQQLQAGQPSNKILVEGDMPTLRFYHNYNTEAAADGGVVQISTDDGTTWNEIADDLFRNPYTPIQYGTFVIPNYNAFSGNSGGWIASYADLSAYAGQEIILRFHSRTDDNTVAPAPAGWWIDDIEIMDLIYYNGEACVSSDQGDQACFTPDSRGTIIESQMVTSTNDPVKSVFLNVFPNPTDDVINLAISSLQNEDVTVSILTLDGRVVSSKAISTSTTTQTFSMNVSDLPSGFYFVKASTNHDVTVEKIVIQ